jgi:dihydroorotase
MAESYDLIIRGGIAATLNGIAPADVAIRAGRIAAIGAVDGSAAEVLDASGLHVLPGVIDTQVHFREPGQEHKEDLATGTAAAALGVSPRVRDPNTKPSTLTAEDWPTSGSVRRQGLVRHRVLRRRGGRERRAVGELNGCSAAPA